MGMDYEKAVQLLEEHGQQHLLKFWDRLDEGGRAALLSQFEALDFEQINAMKALLSPDTAAAGVAELAPAEVTSLDGAGREQAIAEGERVLSAGRVGVLLVAGGQGSRLGFDGPKGCYRLAPVSNASLFEIHARKILALERRYGCEIPFYIMTSRLNDAETKEFFVRNGFFGLSEGRVRFFMQGMWPGLWADGRIILETRDSIFMSPDGHGGILAALDNNGMLDDMAGRGLSTLFYFQVDNPLVEIADPAFVGLHNLRDADISVKVCAKRDANEGLGVVVERGGRGAVVEYTELTDEQKNERLADGNLRYRFGSVAIHVFSRTFLEREARGNMQLHVAHKKVPYCNAGGETVKPDEPNGFKFEKFIFDVIPDAECTVNLEFQREDEFSPVKNADGSDSPGTARCDMILKCARMLAACGVEIPRDATGAPLHKIEIDPCYAVDTDMLREKLPAGFAITGDVLLKD